MNSELVEDVRLTVFAFARGEMKRAWPAILVVWLLLAVFGLALTGAGPAVAASGGGRIVFTGKDGIYVTTPDGTPQRIWQAPAGKSGAAPRWSPDRAHIAFEGPDGNIWVMNADGSAPHAVTAQAVAPAGCGDDLCTAPGTVADSPRWSTDGAAVSYRLVENLAHASIWVAAAAGSTPPQRVAAATDLCLFNEGWSPAGKPLFSRCASESNPSNATYAAAGGSERAVVAGSQLAYTPDGGRLAFSSQTFTHGAFSVELFLANADGGGARLVAEGGQNPVWSITGLLAYRVSSPDGWQMHVFDPATGHDSALGVGVASGWSPDGAWLLYTTSDDAAVSSILRVHPDGSGVQQISSGDFPDWGA